MSKKMTFWQSPAGSWRGSEKVRTHRECTYANGEELEVVGRGEVGGGWWLSGHEERRKVGSD